MPATKHPAWARHLDGIAEELLHLSIACGVQLRDPGVIDRIIRNDASVCATRNPVGFRKLRTLVMALFNSLGKAIDRIGPEEVRLITDAITERAEKARAGTGTMASHDGAGSGSAGSGE